MWTFLRTLKSWFPEISFIFTYTLAQEVSCLSLPCLCKIPKTPYLFQVLDRGHLEDRNSTWSLWNCISHMPEEDPSSRFLLFVIAIFCWKQWVSKLELILICFSFFFFQFTIPLPRKCHYSNFSSTHNFSVIVLLKNMQI